MASLIRPDCLNGVQSTTGVLATTLPEFADHRLCIESTPATGILTLKELPPMRHLARSDIVISANRQRQEFNPEKHQELVNSIQDLGLMHAPVIRREAGTAILVAGERRVKAMDEIWALGGMVKYQGEFYSEGCVPFTLITDLTPLQAEEAELDENLKRADLTWQEHSAAIARLHLLRAAQASAKGHVHTVADTAREVHPDRTKDKADGELGQAQADIRMELVVARHLDNPAIAKAATVKEAYKILKAEEARERNEELAAMVGLSFSVDKHRVFHTSCITKMVELRNAGDLFDVICTDPPYGMNAQDFGDGAGKMTGISHQYDDSPETWRVLMKDFCDLSIQITKPQAHAYIFCDLDRFHELKLFMQGAGWYVFRTPIIIHKLGSGRVPLPDRGPRRQWEMVLYAIKGDKSTTHIYPDVIPSAADESTGHGAQKPVAVVQNLLQRSVRPGDKVFDGFAGSGSIIPAGHALQVEVTACEQSAASYGLCLKRLEALKTPDLLKELEA